MSTKKSCPYRPTGSRKVLNRKSAYSGSGHSYSHIKCAADSSAPHLSRTEGVF